MNGVLLIDKPLGLSSQQVLTKIKHLLNVKKIGHAGTLDPLATGVLVVLINDATKLSDYLLEKEKTYLAEITIGISTTTLDSEGEVVLKKPVTEKIDVDSLLTKMVGSYKQVPPMYSALKKDGKKLYELARDGITVEREARLVEIKEIKRVSEVVYQNDCLKFSFLVKASKGTYIRTLCSDIGEKCGYPAYMSALRRVESGSFKIDDCYKMEDLENNNYKIISMLDALNFLETVEIDGETLKRALNGREIFAKYLHTNSEKIVLANEKKLIAIYEKSENENKDIIYKALRVWN